MSAIHNSAQLDSARKIRCTSNFNEGKKLSFQMYFVIEQEALKCGGNETKTISECAYNNRPNSQYRLNRIERSVR